MSFRSTAASTDSLVRGLQVHGPSATTVNATSSRSPLAVKCRRWVSFEYRNAVTSNFMNKAYRRSVNRQAMLRKGANFDALVASSSPTCVDGSPCCRRSHADRGRVFKRNNHTGDDISERYGRPLQCLITQSNWPGRVSSSRPFTSPTEDKHDYTSQQRAIPALHANLSAADGIRCFGTLPSRTSPAHQRRRVRGAET